MRTKASEITVSSSARHRKRSSLEGHALPPVETPVGFVPQPRARRRPQTRLGARRRSEEPPGCELPPLPTTLSEELKS